MGTCRIICAITSAASINYQISAPLLASYLTECLNLNYWKCYQLSRFYVTDKSYEKCTWRSPRPNLFWTYSTYHQTETWLVAPGNALLISYKTFKMAPSQVTLHLLADPTNSREAEVPCRPVLPLAGCTGQALLGMLLRGLWRARCIAHSFAPPSQPVIFCIFVFLGRLYESRVFKTSKFWVQLACQLWGCCSLILSKKKKERPVIEWQKFSSKFHHLLPFNGMVNALIVGTH